MTREFIITNEQGIHARPATALVQKANEFKSDLYIEFEGRTADLKSIMGVLSLGVTRGSMVTVKIEGPDEIEALKQISRFITQLNLK
jgi:phosphocarrier protein